MYGQHSLPSSAKETKILYYSRNTFYHVKLLPIFVGAGLAVLGANYARINTKIHLQSWRLNLGLSGGANAALALTFAFNPS
ncbi:hypothetical protein CW304_22550 [Bacillus sp. UFRGS-B20]|nr:hypothetical protein CW304_22550 [Bacillus sp. UFRGS-B20]